MKRKMLLIPICILTVFTIVCSLTKCSPSNKRIQIAIAQYIDHPGLNSAKEGFITKLKENGFVAGKNIDINYFNAYGDNVIMTTIVNILANSKNDIILTLATPISQAVKTRFRNINTPIIYGVITDPVSAGLVNSMEKPGDNNTASSDQWPYFEQLELISKYFPNYKKIGIPYNPGEVNTQYAMEQVRKAAKKLGLILIEKPLFNLNDVSIVINSLKNQVDIIYIPADNTAMSAAPAIINNAKKILVPVLAGDPGTFNSGALLGLGVSYFDLGKQTGELAIKIMKGSKAGALPVAIVKNPKLMINIKVAQELNISIPKELIDKADQIIN